MTLLERLTEQRKSKLDALNAIVPKADDETRSAEYTDADDEKAGALLADIAKLDERLASLGELEQRENANAEARRETGTTGGTESPARVTSEPKVYTAETSDKVSWFGDAYRARFMSDRNAAQRLERYARENEVEKRDVGTSAFGGLIPPQYLVDLFAPNVRAGRPTANAVTNLPLPPEGMTFKIPRGTTGTATAVQATENAAVQETDFDETTLDIPVATIAGQQDMSRQALERGTGLDQIIFADLASDYAVTLDRQVLYGSGTGGEMLGMLRTAGINTVAYTDGSATVGEIFPKIADAIQTVVSTRFMPPTGIIMHPRRWAWFTAAVDTTGRPLVSVGTGPVNPMGVGEAAAYGQVVGSIQGLPVITDANVPTVYTGGVTTGGTEDVIIVARLSDCLLWENGATPKELRFEETLAGNLTVKLVVYGYAAFSAGRYPKSVCTITGTGTAPPTF